MELTIRRIELRTREGRTRLPFRFGIHTLNQARWIACRMEVEGSGRRAEGHAEDLMVPKWFEKDPGLAAAEDVRRLEASARRAAAALIALPAGTPFALWFALYDQLVRHGGGAGAPPPLVRGFGVALVERALLDAACRLVECSFFAALKGGLLGFEPARAHPELAGFALEEALAERPLASIRLRHTVGLLDPLRAAAIPAEERVQDGLPQALDEDIREYGLRSFKVKLGGDRTADRKRLLAVAGILEAEAPADYEVTLDGNEQYRDPLEIVQLLDDLERGGAGRFVRAVRHLEQPLARGRSLEPAGAAALRELAARVPLLIDEADEGLESFPRALALGYRGVSVKNCKGVFRALLNFALTRRRGEGFLSAEDLTTTGVLALQQDLATVAALGLPHVERNGHHYFRGLDALPRGEAEEALLRHGDLYRPLDGSVTLRVEGGQLALASLAGPGFGHAVRIRFAERAALDGGALVRP